MAKRTKKVERSEKSAEAPVRRRGGVRVAEEVRLGKFAECEPLHLPQKRAGRGWRIGGGVALLAGTVVGIVMLVLGAPLAGVLAGTTTLGTGLVAMSLAEWVMAVALVVCVIMCLVAGLMLVLQKRVPMGVWCVLMVAVTAVAVSLCNRL